MAAEEAPAEVPAEGEEVAETVEVVLPPPCMDLSEFPPKIDFFDNMVAIDEKAEKVEGANNFRKVSGFPIFGSGQTTEDGFLKVLDKVKALHGEEATEKLLWFNMRKEPVVYINGLPFAPRNPEDLHRNLDVSFSSEELDNLEVHYTNILKEQAAKEQTIKTFKDQAFAENPMDREAVEDVVKVESVKGLHEIHANLRENGFPNLETFRIPVTEERSAGEACFDLMIEALKHEPASTPCVFSDQMGRGRTTSGMVTACLIKEIQITSELR
jgi:hypothetical protein